MPIEHGQNARHDQNVERQMLSKKAHYAFIENRIAHDAIVAEAQHKLALANQEEINAKQALTNSKETVRLAKANLKQLDVDFRTHRRANNARLQREAEKLGAKTYTTNTPCRNGHFSARYTSSSACTVCDKIGWEGGKLRATRHIEEQR